MKGRVSPATLIACVALFFSLAGTGIAARHYLITSLSQIKPSVRAALHGNAGPQGPAGAPGPPGPAGTFDARNVTYSSAQGTACDSDGGGCATVTLTAPCASGTVLGGGWRSVPGEPFDPASLIVLADGPTSDHGAWTATVRNETAETLTIEVSAICAR